MSLFKIIGFLGFLFFSYLLLLLWRLGVLSPLSLHGKQNFNEAYYLTLSRQGPYYSILGDIERLQKYLNSKKLTFGKCLAYYLDDMDRVEEKNLRSLAACEISQEVFLGQPAALENLKLKFTGLQPGWDLQKVKSFEALKASSEASPTLGPWRIYPKLREERRKIMQNEKKISSAELENLPWSIIEVYHFKSNPPQEKGLDYYLPLTSNGRASFEWNTHPIKASLE